MVPFRRSKTKTSLAPFASIWPAIRLVDVLVKATVFPYADIAEAVLAPSPVTVAPPCTPDASCTVSSWRS